MTETSTDGEMLAHYKAAVDGLGGSFTLLRAIRDGQAVVDWEVIAASSLVRSVLRPHFGEVIGARMSRINAVADNSEFHRLYNAALWSGVRQQVELPLRLPMGPVWRNVTVVPVDSETVAVFTTDVTGQRIARDWLERDRARFEALVEGARDLVFVVDVNGRLLYSPSRAADLIDETGIPFMGPPSKLIVMARDLPRAVEWFGEACRLRPGEEQPSVILRFQTADGAIRMCELNARNRMDDPVIGGIVVHLRDITDLLRAEARATALAESVCDIVAITDANATIRWTSPALERVLGYTPQQVVGKSAFELIHPDDHAYIIEKLGDLTTDVLGQSELRLIASDGTSRWFESTGVNRLSDPELEGLVVNLHDITTRRQMELALRDSEARHRGILETAADAIVTVADGCIEGFNHAAEMIFGAPAEYARGRHYTELLPEASVATLREAGDDEPHVRRSIECDARRFNGEVFPAQVSLSRVELADSVLITAIVRDITEQRQAQQSLESMALHDELTGLPNRRLLVDRIDEALGRARRRGGLVGVMFLDLDRFKLVNDSLGHNVGDGLLVQVANRILDALRSTDTLARLGGDEFVILCEEVPSMEVLMEVARRISSVMDTPFVVAGTEIYVSGSIGISVWNGGSDSALDLLRFADTAMYRAKDHGRARLEVFDETMQAWVSERLEFESALRHAIERDELRAYYQPIVEIETGRVTHLEALVRWERPDVGLVMPAEFIAIAEESGLIVPLGEWMLRRATLDCAAWQQYAPGIGVSVNVSARQFNTGDLTLAVRAALDDSSLPTELLTLEITESLLLEDTEHVLGIIHQVRALGVRIALDDFGTGFSSLTYLRRLAIDQLKIDQSFVQTIGTDQEDIIVLRTIVDLGKAYNLVVVAEGIDNEIKLSTLRSIGCDYGQGFLFARPVPVAGLVNILSAGSVTAR